MINQDFVRLIVSMARTSLIGSHTEFDIYLEGFVVFIDPSSEDSEKLREKHQRRKENDFLCKGHILNGISNSIYDAYRTIIFCEGVVNKYGD